MSKGFKVPKCPEMRRKKRCNALLLRLYKRVRFDGKRKYVEAAWYCRRCGKIIIKDDL